MYFIMVEISSRLGEQVLGITQLIPSNVTSVIWIRIYKSVALFIRTGLHVNYNLYSLLIKSFTKQYAENFGVKCEVNLCSKV